MRELRIKVKVNSKEIVIDFEVMHQRLLAVNAHKKIPSIRVFSFEHAPVPLSLYFESGSMFTGKKQFSYISLKIC